MSEVGLGGAKPAKKAAGGKKRRAPQPADVSTSDAHVVDEPVDEVAELRRRLAEAERAAQAEPVNRGVPIDLSGEQVAPTFSPPANPYAPTGWRKKSRQEFDVELPSGQLCRVMRLERDDLLRMNLMEHLDTFTPMLMESSLSDEERQDQMTETVKNNPAALQKMLSAVDKVVLSATVAPQITTDPALVNYGGPEDWANPNFIATVHLDDIDTFERMFIFGAAFGRSMDDLKSVLEQAEGVDGLAN